VNAWRRLVGFLDRRETGEALAVYRVAVGLNVLWAMVSVWAPGLVEVLWLQPAAGGMRPLAADSSWLVGALGGPSSAVVWPLVIGTTLASIGLILGIGSRALAFVCLQGFLAVAWINAHAGGSYDNLLTNALWLLVLARSDATWSLACRLRTGAWKSDTLISSWPRWLIVLQLLLMYCSTGLQKVSASWVPGGDSSALYYILQQPSWARHDMSWVAWLYPVTQAATLSVWLFEVFAPLLLVVLWFRHTRDREGRLRKLSNRLDLRSWFVVYGVAMHLSIHALMVVGPFSTTSIALYAALFSADEWRRGADRLRSLARRLQGSTELPPTQASPTPPTG
jgi:hypothetical protein